MLQALRDKTAGWFTTVLLCFLAFLLALSGIQGYVVSRAGTGVATVGDVEVTRQEFDTRYSLERNQATQLQPDLNFDTKEKREEILQRLADDKALEVTALGAKLLKADDSIRRDIANTPMFQVDGKFDNATFQGLLAVNGMSEADYLLRVRQGHYANVLRFGIGTSSIVTERDVDDFLKLRDQTRNFRFFTLDVNDLPAVAAPTDADIKKYFDANSSRFMTTEYAEFEYVRVIGANLPKVVATEEALRKNYEAQKDNFKTPGRRQAAHILVNVDGGESATTEQQKAAQAIAAKLSERAKAGEDFAELARASSQDLGSKDDGGDLGYIEKGVTEPAFEAKLFAMNSGEISEPILTSQGYHIIKLGEVEVERLKSFEEARAELETAFNTNEATRAFNEKAGKLRDLTLQDPRALTGAAKETGLTIERTGLMTKQGLAENGTPANPIFANPEFLKEAFSAAVIERGQNSNLVTLADGDQLVLRMLTRKKSVLKPIDSVKAEITAAVTADRQAEALRAKADAAMKELAAGKSFDALAAELQKIVETATDAGRNAANRDPAISAEVFKLARPVAGKVVTGKAVMSPDRIALIELSSVKDGDVKTTDKADRDSVRQQLSYEIGAAEAEALKQSVLKSVPRTLHLDRLTQ